MSERKRSPWLTAGIVLCIVLALLGMYSGVYYAMVQPQTFYANMGGTGWFAGIEPLYFWQEKRSHVEGFFSPMHEIDKRIRRDVWTAPLLTEEQREYLRKSNER